MGLKLRLEWYDKQTEIHNGEEFSDDLGEDESVFDALRIPVENNVNNGGFAATGSPLLNLIFATRLNPLTTITNCLLTTARFGSPLGTLDVSSWMSGETVF